MSVIDFFSRRFRLTNRALHRLNEARHSCTAYRTCFVSSCNDCLTSGHCSLVPVRIGWCSPARSMYISVSHSVSNIYFYNTSASLTKLSFRASIVRKSFLTSTENECRGILIRSLTYHLFFSLSGSDTRVP